MEARKTKRTRYSISMSPYLTLENAIFIKREAKKNKTSISEIFNNVLDLHREVNASQKRKSAPGTPRD